MSTPRREPNRGNQGVSPRCCDCGEIAARLVSQTSKNPGRVFYKCPTTKCNFFEWEDRPQRISVPTAAPAPMASPPSTPSNPRKRPRSPASESMSPRKRAILAALQDESVDTSDVIPLAANQALGSTSGQGIPLPKPHFSAEYYKLQETYALEKQAELNMTAKTPVRETPKFKPTIEIPLHQASKVVEISSTDEFFSPSQGQSISSMSSSQQSLDKQISQAVMDLQSTESLLKQARARLYALQLRNQELEEENMKLNAENLAFKEQSS